MSGERFVIAHWQRLLLSGLLFVPCLAPLAWEAWRPTPEQFRALPGALGFSRGTWPFLTAVEGVVLGGLMWLFQTETMIVVVTDDGVTKYRIWRVRWHEVKSARLHRVFGQQYLRIVRTGRLRPGLSLPLDFVGTRSLAAAVRDRAPLGNLIREYIDAAAAGVRLHRAP